MTEYLAKSKNGLDVSGMAFNICLSILIIPTNNQFVN